MRAYAAGRTATTTPGATAGPQLTVANTRAFFVVEVGVFNTTTTAFAVALQRFSAGGTSGAALTETADDDTVTPNVVATGVNSTAATLVGGPYVQASIGAAIGAGVIWTFGVKGLRVPGTASNGIQLIVPTGTGQHFDFYFVWDE